MSDEIKEVEGGDALPSWKDQIKLRGDLRQRDVYAFEQCVNSLGGFNQEGSSILAGHALKAAVAAGWLADPDSEVLRDAKGNARHFIAGEDVDDMHPGKVRYFGLRIVGHYTAAVTPPPN